MVIISESRLKEYKEKSMFFIKKKIMIYILQFKIGELWVDKKRFPSLIEAERFVEETGMTDFRIVEVVVDKTK